MAEDEPSKIVVATTPVDVRVTFPFKNGVNLLTTLQRHRCSTSPSPAFLPDTPPAFTGSAKDLVDGAEEEGLVKLTAGQTLLQRPIEANGWRVIVLGLRPRLPPGTYASTTSIPTNAKRVEHDMVYIPRQAVYNLVVAQCTKCSGIDARLQVMLIDFPRLLDNMAISATMPVNAVARLVQYRLGTLLFLGVCHFLEQDPYEDKLEHEKMKKALAASRAASDTHSVEQDMLEQALTASLTQMDDAPSGSGAEERKDGAV